jgi:hypothetical protein
VLAIRSNASEEFVASVAAGAVLRPAAAFSHFHVEFRRHPPVAAAEQAEEKRAALVNLQ